MGILRRLREWREDKNGTLIGPDIQADSVDAGSVNTGSLTDKDDGQPWETLREAGFETGDFVPLESYQSGDNETTTSNSFVQYAVPDLRPTIDWAGYFPNDATIGAQVVTLADAKSDIIDLRLYDSQNSETIIQELGITTSGAETVTLGPSVVQSTNQVADNRIYIEFRNGDNSTGVELFNGSFQIGVIL